MPRPTLSWKLDLPPQASPATLAENEILLALYLMTLRICGRYEYYTYGHFAQTTYETT